MSKSHNPLFKRTMKLMLVHFFDHNVGQNAAALAYYLLFSLFPLLIFISNFLGLLDLNVFGITQALQQVLPQDAVGIIENYLDHITHTSSYTLMVFSLVFSVWFPMRAVQGLMTDVRHAYGQGNPKHLLPYIGRQLVFTVVFLIGLVLTLLFSILGRQVISTINSFLPEDFLKLSGYLLGAWQYLRFLPVGLMMMATVGTLYVVSLDERPRIKSILPGLLLASGLWLIVSIGFSFFVENFNHYSLIYGALGAVIVLLIWLHLTAMILILGAEFNAALQKIKNENEPA